MPSFTYAFLTQVRPDGTRAPDSSHASSSDGVESAFEVAPLACKYARNQYSPGKLQRCGEAADGFSPAAGRAPESFSPTAGSLAAAKSSPPGPAAPGGC